MRLLKNWLLPGKTGFFWLLLISPLFVQGQIANYVNNGSFEQVIAGTNPPEAKYWRAIDSAKYFGNTLTALLPPFQVPLSGYGYQMPNTGNNYFISGFLNIIGGSSIRGYPLNRLKKELTNGVTYCVKFYCNITNQSTHGIDAIGAYFGNSEMDTITHCTQALTYLTPQVQNSAGNLIIDTLHWVPITGTFVANGTEKYMIIGNFKSDAATNSVLINPANLPTIGTDVLIDDVSCIDINLPAFAGRDTVIYPGHSVFIGREPDAGIDEACTWYKWPDMVNPVGTVAGFWINPAITSTYVVRQQLLCNSNPKWDTVVVETDIYVGNQEFSLQKRTFEVFPNPANNLIELKLKKGGEENNGRKLVIVNSFGVTVRERELKFNNNSCVIAIDNLPPGVYTLILSDDNTEMLTKKLLITK